MTAGAMVVVGPFNRDLKASIGMMIRDHCPVLQDHPFDALLDMLSAVASTARRVGHPDEAPCD